MCNLPSVFTQALSENEKKTGDSLTDRCGRVAAGSEQRQVKLNELRTSDINGNEKFLVGVRFPPHLPSCQRFNL